MGASTTASSQIDVNDPRLLIPIDLDRFRIQRDLTTNLLEPKSPTIKWTPIERRFVHALDGLGLESKAIAAGNCNQTFVPLLECPDKHTVQVVGWHCRMTMCVRDGVGKQRYRAFRRKQVDKVDYICEERSDLIQLMWNQPEERDPAALVRRQRHLLTCLRRLMAKLPGSWGIIASHDIRFRRASLRLFYQGPRISEQWLRQVWADILGWGADASIRRGIDASDSPELLERTLDGFSWLLAEWASEPELRARMEMALHDMNLVHTMGIFRGMEPPQEAPEDAEPIDPNDPRLTEMPAEATHPGACTCQLCHAPLVRIEPRHRKPQSIDELQRSYLIIEFPDRPKIRANVQLTATLDTVTIH